MLAMKACLERVLPQCHERPVTTALACGEIPPGEAATFAGVYESFVRTAGIAKEKVAQGMVEQSARRALALAERAYLLSIGRIVAEGDARIFAHDSLVARSYLGV
jgi:branched-chain amino acid transport system ATP-binding protein